MATATKAPPNPTGSTTQKLLDEAEMLLVTEATRNIKELEDLLVVAHQQWAKAVRTVGIAATARMFGLTPQAVSKKVIAIEQRVAEKRGGS